MSTGWISSLSSALDHLPGPDPDDDRYSELFRHGSMSVLVYAPKGTDPQTPHEQDEIYVVATGSGTVVIGDERRAVKPMDVIFVPARAIHRFEDFTDDLALWVVFYGPAGGEA
jgi:mannose-6-phosphate isomerase-like protein (cupin superfamily)